MNSNERSAKHVNKKLRKNEMYDMPHKNTDRPCLVKQQKPNKWNDKHNAKMVRKNDINFARKNKYADTPDFKFVVVPELFISFWPPSFEDLVRCRYVMPPIFEGNVKDEFLWWLKSQ